MLEAKLISDAQYEALKAKILGETYFVELQNDVQTDEVRPVSIGSEAEVRQRLSLWNN